MVMGEEREKEEKEEKQKEKKRCSRCNNEKRFLHPLKLEGIYQNLCSSCVLITHCDVYCPYCLEDCGDDTSALLRCSTCRRSVHLACQSKAAATLAPAAAKEDHPFRCLHCLNPNSEVAPFALLNSGAAAKKKLKGQHGRPVSVQDLVSAKLIVTAARVASASIHRVAAEASMEARRLAKEAAQLRQEAKDAIHKALSIASEEDHRPQQLSIVSATVANPGNMNTEAIARNLSPSSLSAVPLAKPKMANEPNGPAR